MRPKWRRKSRKSANWRVKWAQAAAKKAVKLHTSRGKIFVRDRIRLLLDPGSPFLEVGMFAGPRGLRFRRPLRRFGLRRGPDRRRRVHDCGQRRHGQRRHVCTAHSQEASARSGDRFREPAALYLPRRLRRRLFADAGRSLSRSRTLRTHLFQRKPNSRRARFRRSQS